MNYLILQNPGHNRVYYEQSEKLALAELGIASRLLETPCLSIESEVLAGVRYLKLETEKELSYRDFSIISNLSFVFALYRREGDFLYPLQREISEYLPEKLSSIQRYHGKTNELFTRMMISVAWLSSDFYAKENIKFLDPVSGRGTGLFEAAMRGMNAYGIEKDNKSVNEGAAFFKTFLKKEHFKYNYQLRPVAGKSKKEAIMMHDFCYAKNKEDFADKTKQKCLGMVSGDTLNASSYFKENYFHLIAGDLPYGIVHANKDRNQKSKNTRNPIELMEQCLPEWHKVLKSGACVAVAWNSFLLPYKRMLDLFTEAGFVGLTDEPYLQFEHRVDQSIKRNVLVARKNRN